MDNIIKPILDGLTGQNGLVIDDVLFDRVSVNWIDTPHDDHFEVKIEYPFLFYTLKTELIIVKSSSGWCYPVPISIIEHASSKQVIKNAFKLWESIDTEDDYYNVLPALPIQNFLHNSKLKDKGYRMVELSEL